MSDLLTTAELSVRWKMNPKSLSNWRVRNVGPSWVKLGNGRNSRVLYRLEDIEAFERSNLVSDPEKNSATHMRPREGT